MRQRVAQLTAAEVTAMAPDAAAVAAGRRLGKAAPWRGLGKSGRAYFGECLGSALYQTQISTLDFATKCTCPSRKFPCKHALGLLYLAADESDAFQPVTDGGEPEWVLGWLEKREAAEQRKQARANAEEKPVDRAAQEKRAERRHDNVIAGIEQLDVWLFDRVRSGLGRLVNEPPSLFEDQARRLVDAQAPGLASRVRSLAARVGVGETASERVLGELGTLALLTHAYRRLDTLPEGLRHDVRRLVGFTFTSSDVIAHGDFVVDEWVVVSSTLIDEGHFRLQRSYLSGVESARTALLLQGAGSAAHFDDLLVPGTAFRARLAFYPSARPERALIAERLGPTVAGRAPPHVTTIGGALDAFSHALARDPWLRRLLFVLDARIARRRERGGDSRVYAIDSERNAVPLRGREHDVLLAVSGGRPMALAGQWNGFELEPLVAYADGRAVSLTGEEAAA
jgi:hypothetical protein